MSFKSVSFLAALDQVTLSAMLLLLACGASAGQAESPEVPAPPGAQDPELIEFPDGQVQLSFTTDRSYPNSEVRDFYADWAEEHGWTRVPAELEPWSLDKWETFEDMQGERIDQWLVHWQSPDRTESLRLALRHVGDRTEQEVFVVRSPFELLTAGGEAESPQAQLPVGACPEGNLKEPVARYEPVPSGSVLQERCPERMVAPNLLLEINSEGRIDSVDFVRASGCQSADEALRRCVSRWVFEPAICDGEPVSVTRGLLVVWDESVPAHPDADPCPPFEETGSPTP